MMLEFRVLGPLELVVDGDPVELPGQRQRMLLAALLLRPNRVVPTERLVFDLWGEEPPRTATTSLQNSISQLRRILGESLVRKPPGYMLQVEDEQVDALRFEHALRAARELAPVERADALHAALASWRGPPFADLPYETFLQGEVRRLEELRVAAIEERFAADLERGEHASLVPELETLVGENPLRERLREQLMLALYRAGRQAEALDAYTEARRTLADELGIDPGPGLRRLHGAILRQDESLVAAVNAGGPSRRLDDDHVSEVGRALLAGRVVPVLGANPEWLASQLAERFRYPQSEAVEVPRVSQFAAATRGYGPLYDELHALASADGEPTAVHRFFASLPPLLRERGAPHQLLVTTEYRNSLERAFADAGEEVDVVSYVASGRNRGRFCHRSPDGQARVVDVPNTYATEIALDRRTVILKVRGGIDLSPAREWESFVVTEDDYIEYLGRADVASSVPVALAATLRRSHFLFLGYTMRDWNLRVVLGRMWGEMPLSYRSWAVHETPGPAERELWRRVDVDLVVTPLATYIDQLASAVGVGVRMPA
jgi:DNA-binding SARP family transcriptional activator